jgi:hypothetical protein
MKPTRTRLRCPYCGNRDGFTEPIPLCSGLPPDSGIPIPTIQQCERCGATLSPAAFTPFTPPFVRAWTEHHRARTTRGWLYRLVAPLAALLAG